MKEEYRRQCEKKKWTGTLGEINSKSGKERVAAAEIYVCKRDESPRRRRRMIRGGKKKEIDENRETLFPFSSERI